MCARNKKKLLYCLFAIFPMCSLASNSTVAEPQAQALLVRDLIQKENERLAQGVVGSTVVSTPYTEQAQASHPKLIAMYGVGKKVLAEVDFNGQQYLYVRGQTWPVGDVKGSSQLRLIKMSSRCAHLAFQKTEFNLCVTPQGGNG